MARIVELIAEYPEDLIFDLDPDDNQRPVGLPKSSPTP
jgi:hypothetical protein